MTLSQVVAALNGAISPAGQINLFTAANDPAIAPLKPILARFTITSDFIVSGARLAPAATSAVLTGAASWGLPGAPAANVRPVSVRLDCVGTSDVVFTLTLAMSEAGWTFERTFAGLPETMRLEAANQAVMPGPSFLIGVQLNNAAFSGASTDAAGAGLAMSGSLPTAPFWSQWATLVTPWPLQLSGLAALPASYDLPPLLELVASGSKPIPLANPLLDLGALALSEIGFGLVSQPGPDPDAAATDAYSVLNLRGRLQVGGLVAWLTTPILAAGGLWHFLVDFEQGDVVEGMSQLGTLFGLPELPTPPDFLPIPRFRFDSVEFYLDPGTNLSNFSVTYIAASIVSSESWTSPAPFVTVEDVGISWVWGYTPVDGTATGYLVATIFGTLAFGTDDTFHIDCAVQVPDWASAANLREGDVIPIGAAFRNYFGSPGPPTPADMNVTGLAIDADPQEQSYYGSADIVFGTPPEPEVKAALILRDEEPEPEPQGWDINLIITTVTLRTLSFHVSVVGGELAGGIAGTFLFGEGSGVTPATFELSAEYPGPAETHPEGWTFAGALAAGAAIQLTALVARFIGQDPVPDWVPQINVDRLYFSFNTGTPVAYTFGGTISVKWTPTIFGTTLKVSAAASLDLVKAGGSDTATGTLEGMFSINRLTLSAGLTLGVPEPTYQFMVQFDELWLRALTSWRDDSDGSGNRHQVISLQLGGVTIGGILEYLVNLAAPTLGYSLDSPWNILNQIELSRFTLTLDPKESVVEFVYAANANLVFMQLDTIGIRYTRGKESGVSLILTGELLGKRYDGDDLAWDVIDESPPPLPGQSETFIELRYVGLGQRVQLSTIPDTVAASVALLKSELDAPEDGKNPLEGQGVVWSPTSQWLIGLDIGLLDTIDLGIIFNDPWIYGLSIALGGEEAGSLSGLRFEILYKKISDTVGMFRIELTLPEAFRHFEFGEVSVTLGVVVIEIYTNGNFKVDLGFPYNRNFDRSFSVEVFPFLGRGGIYFGLLDGTTSKRVPKITNGNFAPVIELGVGLAVGVGKDISFGPLSGGIYVQVEVIFEGVLGWFHPSAAGGSTATYYWAQGVAAIHGKLYGSVDFKVIKVSVTLEAYAAATVTLEAYRPTQFRLEVSVRAEAEIKILFVRISFSFSVDVNVSFQVGQERPTPWILATDQSRTSLHAPSPAALALGVDSHGRRRARAGARGAAKRRAPVPSRRPDRRRAALRADYHAQLDAGAGATAVVLNWQPAMAVFTDSPRTAPIHFIPSFTVTDVPLSWTATAPANPSPNYRFAMQLFAPTGVTTEALTAAEARRRSAALAIHAEAEDDLDALAADTLIQGLLYYALYAIPNGPQTPTGAVTAGQLDALAAMLDDPVAVGDGFASGTVDKQGKLATFYATNIHLAISGLPEGEEDPAEQSSMAMAVPPFLGWASAQTGPVDFQADNQIGPLYLWGAQKQAASFSPTSQVYECPGACAHTPPCPPDDPLSAYVSFASHLFGDWNLMVAKSAVREAIAALDNRVLAAAGASQSLSDIAKAQPTAKISYPVRPGDTVETVADALGATVDEIEFLNKDFDQKLKATPAGANIDVIVGVSPEVLAADNPAASLMVADLTLGDLVVPVAATDTLNVLATRYGVQAAAILGGAEQEDDAKLLAAGALYDAPATSWTAAPIGFTALLAAAVFYTRYAGVPTDDQPDGPFAAWYSQALADLNATKLSTLPIDPRSGELPPGTQLDTPVAYQNATAVVNGYTSVPGDTLARIGAALNLQQNQATTTGATGWPPFRDAVTGSGAAYAIPAFTGVAILPGETFTMLARQTIVNWVSNGASPAVWSADWAGLAAWVGDAPILAPLALITIPAVATTQGTSFTFASLANAYGLTLTDLGRRLAGVPGLVSGESLTVRHLPADTLQSLVALVTERAAGSIAHEASRYLFSGQEIPVPVPVPGQTGHVEASTSQISPLFDQSRQQWSLTVDHANPTGIALALTLSTQVSWIALFDSTTVGADESADALAARVPGAAGLNRALAAGRALPAGAILHTAEAETLSYSVTNQEVEAAVPVTALAWPPYKAPAAIEVKGEAAVTYGLAQHVALQSAVQLPVPGYDVARNTLSIHPFPDALTARARGGSTSRYGIYAGQTGTAGAVPVASGTFATLIAFTVRRLVEAPGVYQLNGAAVEQMPLLLDLVDYLTDTVNPPPPGTVARVAMPPATTAADPNGLALTGANAWLIKSNLSTETVPQNLQATRRAPGTEDEPAPLCRADLTDPAAFALLLWEGSSVGGIGYTFGVDGGLADGAFDASDQAVIQFLVIAGAQQAAAPAGRALLKFNTSALAVDQDVPEGATLFAEAEESADPTEYAVQALVPAGSTGFTVTLTRPIVPPGGTSPADQLNAFRQQYSLLTAIANAAAGAPYTIPAYGMPASPQASDGTGSTPVQRERTRRRLGATVDPAPKPYWAYQTVLPVYRFGPPSVTAAVPGLPAPEADPYRGLGTAASKPQVAFELGFGDVLGNRTDADDDYALGVTIGYSDPLNGPAGWPAVNSYYDIKNEGGIQLRITLAAKAQALMPAVAQRGDALVQSAARQRDLYATIYYQYAQPGLTATVETTLQTGSALPVTGEPTLSVFAAGAYLNAAGATLYAAVMPAAGALGTIVSDYGIGWEALASVNADVPLAQIFGESVGITVPAYAVMASGDTATSIAAVPRSGWPTPSASEILSAPANKDALPLKAGAVLAYTPRAVTIANPAPLLSALAAAQATTAALLAADSAADAILTDGFTFVVDEVEVVVGTSTTPAGTPVRTFSDAVAAFAALGVHVGAGDLGLYYADAPNLLLANAVAHVAHYSVSGEATLSSNPSGAATADLIDKNLKTANLYEAGALIYLGDFGSGDPKVVTPGAGETLGGFAGRYACPPATLLFANKTRAVIAGTALAIPGAAALPDASLIYVPYTIRTGDILSGIAAGFDLAAAPDKATALADRNAALPGTVAQGQSFDVDVGGTQVPVETTGLTSFAAVLAKVKETAPAATMADVAAAFETPGRLAVGGLLVCPPALLAAATAPSGIKAPYGVEAAAFGLANAGVTGLVAQGVTLAAPDAGIGSVTTAARDTLNSVVGRFNGLYLEAGRQAVVTVASMIDANPAAPLFAAQAHALLPPADIVLMSPLSATGPYPGAAFALTVELVVNRPQGLIQAGFEGSNVEVVRATIAAPAATAIEGGSMTFDTFEKDLRAALPNLRLGTAKMEDHAADLWAVDFGPAGITEADIFQGVSYDGGKLARMIGLAPLYGELVSRAQVPIAPLVAGSLDPAQSVNHDYQGIDVEIWAARFLSDFDRLIDPANAAAINAIVALRPQFVGLITAKRTLQQAIPADLASIFKVAVPGGDNARAVTDPNLAAGLTEARRVLGQSLGVSLSAAWATAAIVQYDSTVNSAWTRGTDPTGTAALYGEGRTKPLPDPSPVDPPPGDPPIDPPVDPRWRLAAGKLSLAETAPFLTLPLSVSDPGAQSYVPLDLTYAVSNLEIHRRPAAEAPGYVQSDWLAMTPVLTGDDVPAALGVDLGEAKVPIPLKAFPALPLIVSQTGLGDPTEPPTLTTASLWTFRLVYSHEHLAQDHVAVTVELNLEPPTRLGMVEIDPADLFAALAQYVAVADDLNGLLAGLTDPKKQVPQPQVEAAVATFADLANIIAGLWGTRLPTSGGDAPGGGDDWVPTEHYPFSAAVTYAEQGSRLLAAYTLTRLDGAVGPGLDWPEIECQAADGSWHTLVGQAAVGTSRAYVPLDGVEIALSAWPSFALAWPRLNSGATQNGRVSLEVVRNIDLVPNGPATAEAFVYRTAIVTASDIVTPAISRTGALAMAGASVEAALQAAFDALFPAWRSEDLRLTFGLYYGYTLVPGPEPLVSELAAGLIPDQRLDDGTAALIAGALDSWQERVKPNSEGGLWVVSLALYSSFDPGKRVLLSIERLTYPLSLMERAKAAPKRARKKGKKA